jgi:hypothetical protein
MKKLILMPLAVLAFSLIVNSASGETRNYSKGSMCMTIQAGLNSMVRTADRFADPFRAMPFPLGAGFEVMMSDNLGIGGTIMCDKWSDYLGMFGGKWTFRLFKPSFDISYHFRAKKIAGMDFVAGAGLGYSLISVNNELGNQYKGGLKSEPHLAPFLGTNLYFWEDRPGFLGRLAVTLKAVWSVTGRFSGVYGSIGITYRMKQE